MKIRRLYPWELMDAFPVLEAFNAECGSPLELDRGEFAKLCASLSAGDCGAFWAAFDADGRICALIGGHVHRAPASKTLRASELAWYVQPEHRGGTLGIRLIKEFEAWAKSKGAKSLIMASFETSPTKEVGQMLARMGFRQLETYHCLNLEDQ